MDLVFIIGGGDRWEGIWGDGVGYVSVEQGLQLQRGGWGECAGSPLTVPSCGRTCSRLHRVWTWGAGWFHQRVHRSTALLTDKVQSTNPFSQPTASTPAQPPHPQHTAQGCRLRLKTHTEVRCPQAWKGRCWWSCHQRRKRWCWRAGTCPN